MRAVCLGVLLGLLLMLFPQQAQAEDVVVHGLVMIPWAKQMSEDRFRSPRDWDATLKWFDKAFAGDRHIKKGGLVNVPAVKYVHWENRNPKAKWSGLNMYQAGEHGDVMLYVLERLPDDPPAKKATP